MAQPPVLVLDAMMAALTGLGLSGWFMVARENLHQSLSNNDEDSPDQLRRLLRAGEAIAAEATRAMLLFNRIIGTSPRGRGFEWKFSARGTPPPFTALNEIAKRQLIAAGAELENTNGHTPHVTVSYCGPRRLPSTPIEPIEWTIDELRLVRGTGKPYRYDVLERWPLRAAAAKEPSAPQLELL